MILFKITLQADELLYGDYEKMSLISEITFRKFLQQFKTKTSFNTLYCDGNVLAMMDLVCNFKCFFFYCQHFISLNRPNLSKVMLF